MRPINSDYDRYTSETREADPGLTTYAFIANHNGPCSLLGEFDSLDDAIKAARFMNTDTGPTELEDMLEYDGSADSDELGLISAAEEAGWHVVATSGAGEYWTVMVQNDT